MALEAVVDTVIVRYFLFVDRADLLIDLLRSPIGVSRIVYDPEEGDVPEQAMSEITRSIVVQQRMAADRARGAQAREDAARNAERLIQIDNLCRDGHVTVLDMESDELQLVGLLTTSHQVHNFDLRFPLDSGEAASLAIAFHRGLVFATDDADALRALRVLDPRHPYERIRKLLRRAVREDLVERNEAVAIHREMRRLGFWDADAL